MARSGPAGRGGRGGRNSSHFYGNPKYLSNPPPHLEHQAPDLSSNPYFHLQKQYTDGSAFLETSSQPSNPTTPPNKTATNDNGWKTFFNNKRLVRKKSFNKSNLTVKSNNLQRMSISSTTTTTTNSSTNFNPPSHNLGSPSKITLQATFKSSSKNSISPKYPPKSYNMSPVETPTHSNNPQAIEDITMTQPMLLTSSPTLAPHDEFMEDEMPPDTNMADTDMPDLESNSKTNIVTQPGDADNVAPATPPRPRRSKKSKATSPPITTPTKKGKSSTTLAQDSPPPQDLDTKLAAEAAPGAKPTATSSPDDEDLGKMTKSSLISEVFRMAKETGHAVSEDAFKSLSLSVLLARAKELRASLSEKHSASKKKPGLIPIIKFDTPDQVITNLDSTKARSVFMSCLRKQKKKIVRTVLDGMSIKDFQDEIFKYRSSLIAQDMDFSIDDPTLGNPDSQSIPNTNNESTTKNSKHDNMSTSTASNSNATSTENPHFLKEPMKPKSDKIVKPVTPPRTPKIQSTNVNRYTSEKHGQKESVFPPKKGRNKNMVMEQYIISIRSKFYRDYAKMSLSALASYMISLVREVDGSMLVLSLSDNVNDEIDNENLFPEDNEGAQKYLAEVSVDQWCTKFMLRCKVTASTKTISTNIISYMAETKNYAKVDKLSAHRVSCIGFMNSLHPYRHNRERLTKICEDHVRQDTGRIVHLNVLPRGLSAGKGLGLVESHFIAIEVSSEDAQVVSTSLMAKKFHEYPNCRFVPMTKYDDNYEKLLKCIISSHRQLCLDTNFVTVNDLQIKVPVRIESEEFSSIKEILLSTNDPSSPLIHDIDVAPNGATNIIYNVNADDQLEKFLHNLHSLISTHVHQDDVHAVYQNTVPTRKILDKRRVTQFEKNHIADLHAMYNINPQEPSNDTTPTPSVKPPPGVQYKSNKNKHATQSAPHGTPSYLTATSRNVQQTTKTQQVDSARLSNVENSVANMNNQFLTEDQVKILINQSTQNNYTQSPTMTAQSVQKLIDNTLNGQPLHALLDPNFDSELDIKISAAVKKIQLPTGPSTEIIQSMIDTSISSTTTEIYSKIDNVQTQVSNLDTNVTTKLSELTTTFEATVAAFTKQSAAILAALNQQPLPTPAIRIPDGPGAKDN